MNSSESKGSGQNSNPGNNIAVDESATQSRATVLAAMLFVNMVASKTNIVKGIPTNSKFIALIADKLQLQLKSSKVANF